jgi:hypothetical protein
VEEDFYSVDEAARILRLTPGRIRQMLRAGELEGIPPEEGGGRGSGRGWTLTDWRGVKGRAFIQLRGRVVLRSSRTIGPGFHKRATMSRMFAHAPTKGRTQRGQHY